jgi:uncharacterized protein DUF4198
MFRTLFLLPLLTSPALAHDFWISPSSYHPADSSLLQVNLLVGDFGRGDPLPRSNDRLLSFTCTNGSTTRPIVGRDGSTPAGYFRLQSPGLHLLAYHSTHASVELAGEKFSLYLRERGLDPILALRESRGQSSNPAREVYSRCCKSLVRVGDIDPGRGFDTPLALPLELVPLADPTALHTGEPLPVQLLFRGQPLANALIGALSLDTPQSEPPAPFTVSARTDAEGRAKLALPRGGRWLVTSVHMIEASDVAVADFESFWASLTFEAPQLEPAHPLGAR